MSIRELIQRNTENRKVTGKLRRKLEKQKATNYSDQQALRKETPEYITGMLDSFMARMKYEWERNGYIKGLYSDDFTKFVDRNSKRWGDVERSISDDHRKAIDEFTEARKNLNRVFVNELDKLTDAERESFCSRWSLKNLGKHTVSPEPTF